MLCPFMLCPFMLVPRSPLLHFSILWVPNVHRRVLSVPGTHVLDEAERSLHDALCVLAATVKDKRVVLGGGFPEMAMARVVRGTLNLA